MNTEHLDALELSLSHERARLSAAKSTSEVFARTAWCAQIEKEIAGEKAFLGMTDEPLPTMTDDELFAALSEAA